MPSVKTVRHSAFVFCVAGLAASATAQLTPIGPFTGTHQEGFQTIGQWPPTGPCTFCPTIPDAFGGIATLEHPTGAANLHITGGWGFVCSINSNLTPRLAASTGGGFDYVFPAGSEAYKFGGYFGTNAGVAGGTIEFYDSNMTLIGSDVLTHQADCQWVWHGWESTVGIHRVRVIGNYSGGGYAMMDDMEYDGTPTNPNAIGACCFTDGSCQFITYANCVGSNGSFRGENVQCSQANCPQPGACCMNDGSCDFLLEADCETAGGQWAGANVTCAQANCPQPTACCLFDGSCTTVVPVVCAGMGGAAQPAGSQCGTVQCPSVPSVIFSNCNLTTGPTTLNGVAAPSGAEWSECAQDEFDPTTANTTAGFGVSGALRLADDFAVPAGGMELAYVKVPVYTTNATSLTVTGATLQIWDGPPNDPSSNIIFGDTTTNRMAHAEWSDVYRTFNTVTPAQCGGALTAPTTARRQQWTYIAVHQNLAEGTYWLDWNVSGASFAPTATRASAIGRQCDNNNSNGMQLNGGWVSADDAGQGCNPFPLQQDLYFELMGETGAQCYANCDGSTVAPVLNVDDFTCFINEFAAAQSLPLAQQIAAYANCDGSTVAPVLNVDDFTCFINEFAAGCN